MSGRAAGPVGVSRDPSACAGLAERSADGADRACPIAAALRIVGPKWALLAIGEILEGNHRFNAIARNTGAPHDRLAARLRDLEDAGILERRTYYRRPPRCEYHLTEAGRALLPVVEALRGWGEKWALGTSPGENLVPRTSGRDR